MSVAGVILAGGLSRRMGGGDKTLMPLAGRPMLAHVIDRLRAQVQPVALNANGDPARFAGFGLPVIADTFGDHSGPLAGVLAGMEWAKRTDAAITHIVTVAGDTPLFPRNLVAGLLSANGDSRMRIVLAMSGGNRHPVFGLWPVALAVDLATWMASTDTFKVLAWVRNHDHAFADFPIEGGIDPFFNANAPEDLVELERLASLETAP